MKRALLAGFLLAAAPVATVAAQNWDATFVRSEEGHRLGNPEAETQLIAFVSYSCPHCASFEMESDAPLRLGYVMPGTVNLEVRHVIRNPLDLAAALTSECGDEDKFWGNHRAIMRAQDEWLQVAIDAQPSQTARWTSGDMASRMRAIASDLDFYDLMKPRGYSAAQLDQCLGDDAAMRDIVARMQADNANFEIPGTPSFAVNGTMLPGIHSWGALEPHLAPAAEPATE